MTTPVFTNNAATTLNGSTTTIATSIIVTDASVFSTKIQNGAGSTNNNHQLATIESDAGIEIIKITEATTATNTLTVVREQEGTTGIAFADGAPIEVRLTAQSITESALNRDTTSDGDNIPDNAVDIVTCRLDTNDRAGKTSSIAIGCYAGAIGDYGIALGFLSEAGLESVAIGRDATAPYNTVGGSVAIGRNASCDREWSVSIGEGATCDFQVNTAVGYSSHCNNTYGVAIGASAVAHYYATACGATSNALGSFDTSIGNGASTYASGSNTFNTAIGMASSVISPAVSSIALGYYASAQAISVSALGPHSITRITKTHNISGPSIIRKDNAETDEVLYFSGQENIIFSQEYDFTLALADNIITIEIPTGSAFYVSEVGFVPTSVNTITSNPTIEFGVNTTTDAIMTAVLTTTQTAKKRERYLPVVANTNWVTDAENTGATVQLTLSVTVAAAATTFLARVYFKGFLLEDE